MDSTTFSALLMLAMLSLSSSPLALACHSCATPPSSSGTPAITLPPVTIPMVPLPPISIPMVPVPPVSIPTVPLPPVSVPNIPVTLPPIGLPPVSVPIIGGGSPKYRHRKACPPPPSPTPTPPCPSPTPTPPSPSSDTCPIDTLKLGACVDVLGNEVHIGDTNVKCCPLVQGIAGVSVAACLCTTIKAKLLDINVYLPIALTVLVGCGCSVPPGYTCP